MIFDLDQTLVDQEAGTEQAVVEWAAERGIVDPQVVSRWAAATAVHYTRYQTREISFVEQRRARVRDFLATPLADEEADREFADYLWRYERGWALFPDAIPALQRARDAGWQVVILTNGEASQQRLKLDRLGLTDLVDLMCCSSELPAAKPDPRAFTAVLALAAVSADQALMVGDSLTNDIHGAQACQIAALLLDRESRHRDQPSRITSLDELSFDTSR